MQNSSANLENIFEIYNKLNTILPYDAWYGLDEAQAGIKISRRIIDNLRYADDTILKAESEEELKSLSMKLKRRVKKLA